MSQMSQEKEKRRDSDVDEMDEKASMAATTTSTVGTSSLGTADLTSFPPPTAQILNLSRDDESDATSTTSTMSAASSSTATPVPDRKPTLTLKSKEVRVALNGLPPTEREAIKSDAGRTKEFILRVEGGLAAKKEKKDARDAEARNRPDFEKKQVKSYFPDAAPGTKIHITTADEGQVALMRKNSHWFDLDEVKGNTIVYLQQDGIAKEAQGYTDRWSPNRAKGIVYYTGDATFNEGSETNRVGKEYQNAEPLVPTGYIKL